MPDVLTRLGKNRDREKAVRCDQCIHWRRSVDHETKCPLVSGWCNLLPLALGMWNSQIFAFHDKVCTPESFGCRLGQRSDDTQYDNDKAQILSEAK